MDYIPKIHLHLDLQNVVLYGNRVFANIIKLEISRWDDSRFRVDPKSNGWSPYQRRGHTETWGLEGDHMKMETKIKVMRSQAREYWKPPEAGRSKEECSLEPSEEAALMTPWFWTSGPQIYERIERINFCCFKSPSYHQQVITCYLGN